MELRRITFEGLGLSIDCWPAIPEHNAIFDAARKAILAPHQLAITAGLIADETALRIFAKCYAEGVIEGSPSPDFCDFSHDDWAEWLASHPEEFDDLQQVVSNPAHFGLSAHG